MKKPLNKRVLAPQIPFELANMLICSGCLGSRSDAYNEIVECDGCGVTVHEGM